MPPFVHERRQLLAATLCGFGLAACGRRSARARALPAGSTVLALGDSLTEGVGSGRDKAWPALLQARTRWTVVNAGVSGDTSAQALARLPALLAEHRPALVIASIGGNDFLRQANAAETRENLARICTLAREGAAAVLLVAVPGFSLLAAGTGRLRDHPLYAELASTLHVPLYANGWSRVLSDSALKADAIHANARGQQRFTDGLVDVLRGEGWLA